jgi:hypothetical protein
MPHVDDRVRLLDGVPNTDLAPGQVGVVCSTWSGCNRPVFEVEFVSPEQNEVSRRLLTIEQICVDDDDGNVTSH